jgi:hypothetical protein
MYVCVYIRQNMSFTMCPILLQWHKRLENDISDLKNNYS